MAEPIVLDGSPLDQYLQDAERAEASSEVRLTSPSRPSNSTLATIEALTPSSSFGTDLFDSPASVQSAASEFKSIASSPRQPPRIGGRKDTVEAALYHPTTSAGRVSWPVSHTPTKPESTSTAFSSQFVATLQILVLDFFVPLLLFSVNEVLAFGIRAPKAQDGEPHDNRVQLASKTRIEASPSISRSKSASNSFAERFKFLICSSFLLTPTLSISFYESEPPPHNLLISAEDASDVVNDRSTVSGRRASPSPLSIRSRVLPSDHVRTVLSDSAAKADIVLPRLTSTGRQVRNTSLMAIVLLALGSESWDLWFRTTLLIGCVAWATILSFDLGSLDDHLCVQLSHQPRGDGETFLRDCPVTKELSSLEKALLQQNVLRDSSNLIAALQALDVSVNKAINAVQEVELVSRGYKLTHPLPPISRIEAASGAAWQSQASPARRNSSLKSSVPPSSTVRLSRSSSSGAASSSYRRHGHRPLSLNLSLGRNSPSGRASPAMSSDSLEAETTKRLLAERSGVVSAATAPGPRRLLELRKMILVSLEAIESSCQSAAVSLDSLVDKEELLVLKEMYALDSSSNAETMDADVSMGWSNADGSVASNGSPELDDVRRGWTSTTPRNFGSRIRAAAADLSATSDLWNRSGQSPPAGYKRLSLMSEGSSNLQTSMDRNQGASSSLSRRSSMLSEAGIPTSYRSPRFTYVSEKSANASGPNDSAASKRLSYVSGSSRSMQSPASHTAPIMSAPYTPPHATAHTYSAATSPQSRATKRSSIIGPKSIFGASATVNGASNQVFNDALSLLGLKNRFESMHRVRRLTLCHLLALHLSTDAAIPLEDGRVLDLDLYWSSVRTITRALVQKCEEMQVMVKETVTREMVPDSLSLADRTDSPNDIAISRPSACDLLGVPEDAGEGMESKSSSSRIHGHLGFEDRLQAMMLSLRSIQAKIRVCAEEAQVKSPPGLHGSADEGCSGSKALAPLADTASEEDQSDSSRIESLEKVLETVKDDLLDLSAEWEAGLKILRKERRRSPSLNLMLDTEGDMSRSNAARDLVSPLEADEDAVAGTAKGIGEALDAQHNADQLRSTGLAEPDAADQEGEEEDDLATLLLRSTSPNSLPPPGLEQVFESIAGMAGFAGLGPAGRKLTREERIEHTRRRRQEQEESAHSTKANHRHSMDPSSMLSELSEVIQSRKAIRQQHRATFTGLTMPDDYADEDGNVAGVAIGEVGSQMHNAALGSPLDLGTAGQEGVFDQVRDLSKEGSKARRSMSSLDLARARASQNLGLNGLDPNRSADRPPRTSDDFPFEPTPLEMVPEDELGALVGATPPSAFGDSTSRKSTPKASAAALSASPTMGDSPFDLGAQVAAYARRKAAAAEAHAAAAGVSTAASSTSSLLSDGL